MSIHSPLLHFHRSKQQDLYFVHLSLMTLAESSSGLWNYSESSMEPDHQLAASTCWQFMALFGLLSLIWLAPSASLSSP